MLAKMNVLASSEVGLMAAVVGADHHGHDKEEWDSDSGATLHMSHTRAGMTEELIYYDESLKKNQNAPRPSELLSLQAVFPTNYRIATLKYRA